RFTILDTRAAGRKEIILFLLFAAYIFYLDKGKLISWFVTILFSLLLTIAAFFHKLVLFYAPYFVLAAYMKSQMESRQFNVMKLLVMLAGPLLATCVIYFWGKPIDGSIICLDRKSVV